MLAKAFDLGFQVEEALTGEPRRDHIVLALEGQRQLSAKTPNESAGSLLRFGRMRCRLTAQVV
jgi:hypothetical protein